MDDANFKPPQLHREEFVLTENDLRAIRNGYAYQCSKVPGIDFLSRFKFKVAVGTIDALLDFLANGKIGKEINIEDDQEDNFF